MREFGEAIIASQAAQIDLMEQWLSDVREASGSLVDEVEPRIRELLQATPTMPATVVAERIGCSHRVP